MRRSRPSTTSSRAARSATSATPTAPAGRSPRPSSWPAPAGEHASISSQNHYNRLDRRAELATGPAAEAYGLGVMPYFPLANGLLTGKYTREQDGPRGSRRTTLDFPPVDRERAFACVDVMRTIGAAHGTSVARVALASLYRAASRHHDHHRCAKRAAAARQHRRDDARARARGRRCIGTVSALPPGIPGVDRSARLPRTAGSVMSKPLNATTHGRRTRWAG